MGIRQKLKSNLTRSIHKDDDLDYELSGVNRGSAAVEFDVEEICDDF